jgi:hypothetical protein
VTYCRAQKNPVLTPFTVIIESVCGRKIARQGCPISQIDGPPDVRFSWASEPSTGGYRSCSTTVTVGLSCPIREYPGYDRRPFGEPRKYLRHPDEPIGDDTITFIMAKGQVNKVEKQTAWVHAAVQLRDDDIDRSLPYRLGLGSPHVNENRPSGTRQPPYCFRLAEKT